MTVEERFQYAYNICLKVDNVCVFDGSFCEGCEEHYANTIMEITKIYPELWENARSSFEFAYSNMFCKLLLAYLVKEVREGNLLDKEFLNCIKEEVLTSYYDFDYCDTGIDTAEVLSKILIKQLERSNYFKRDYEIIDTEDVMNEDSGYGIRERLFYDSLSKAFPLLKKEFKEEDIDLLYNICNYPEIDESFEAELEIIESHIMYLIEKKEAENPTIEGNEIIEKSKIVLKFVLQDDYLYNDLAWKIVDDENEKIYYCSVTCSSVYGDECYYPMMTMPRIHRYRYACIFEIYSLCKKIDEYIQKYNIC